MPELIEQLARQQKPVVLKCIETVSQIAYLGDMGGIVMLYRARGDREHDSRFAHCPANCPLPQLCSIQKHRVKKLRKQAFN